MACPEIIINHSGLVLEIYVFEPAQQANAEIGELVVFAFVEFSWIRHAECKNPGFFRALSYDGGHFRERRGGKLICLRVSGGSITFDLDCQIPQGYQNRYRGCNFGDNTSGFPCHENSPIVRFLLRILKVETDVASRREARIVSLVALWPDIS